MRIKLTACGTHSHDKNRRLSHAACNQARNEFKLQAERDFKRWIAQRQQAAARDPG